MHLSLVIDELEIGAYRRRPQSGGFIFHSDRRINTPRRLSYVHRETRHLRLNEPEGQLLG